MNQFVTIKRIITVASIAEEKKRKFLQAFTFKKKSRPI